MSPQREIVIRKRGDTFAFKLPEAHELAFVDVKTSTVGNSHTFVCLA